ncbi:MAG: lytic transglycosylase, partial [Propionivibrio sp.]
MRIRSKTIMRSCCLVATLVAFGAGTPVAAKSGNGQTSSELENVRAKALAYEHGEGVPKDLFRAATLYCSGARQGDAEAQFSLGWMYANGRGVP